MKTRSLIAPLAAALIAASAVALPAVASSHTKREQQLAKRLTATQRALKVTRTRLATTQTALAGAQAALAAAAAAPAPASVPGADVVAVQAKLAAKASELTAAQSDATTLRGQLATAIAERDGARASLADKTAALLSTQNAYTGLAAQNRDLGNQVTALKAAQTQPVVDAIGQLTPIQAFGLLPTIAARMSGKYSASHYTAAGYESWDFAWSSCC